ncbi:hypothetical protein [Bacillus sp. Brlt_9]|uniref:hypothetical protein n=1 Tax=Bacillus sp. Brlt_9 TaxID=3110916 RepID=UPI003F7BAA91
MNHRKYKRIMETEKVIQRIQDGTTYYCSNENCKNKVVFKDYEEGKVVFCGKCHTGIFVKNKKKKKRK